MTAPTPSIFPAHRELPIFEALPELRAVVPVRPLVHGPTPVGPCDALEDWLGRGGVFQKRDDLASPLYGGNKVRRFELLLADAERRGAKHLVTVGGLASTQVLATILFGKALGFDVTAAMFDQPVTTFARRILRAAHASGGHLIHAGGYLQTALSTLKAHRGATDPYLVLPGASTPLPLVGFVDAMLELGEQIRRGEVPRPDILVVPSGSAGTLAALSVGCQLLGYPTRVVGVRITEALACNHATVRVLVEALLRFLGRHSPRARRLRGADCRFEVFGGALGGGYGHPTVPSVAAIPAVEKLLGVPGEVTYSAKGMVGLRAIARANPRATVLYWHTLSSAPLPGSVDAPAPPGFESVFAAPVVV